MLNPFPDFLMYAFVAPTLLRMAAGFVFVYLAVEHTRHRIAICQSLSPLIGKLSRGVAWWFAIFEVAIAASLLLGLYTQIGAIVGIIAALKFLLIRPRLHALAPLSRSSYLLLAVILVSLLITGAGAFAYDLPL